MEELKSSIVHEYSILYSNRIIQKDKKWNDGKLKYYEFNNKLEIFNEDGNLIEVDFISEKFKHNLVEQNEFKLPNNRLIIEIDSKLSSYIRDVSELFKRSAKDVALTSPTKLNAIGITKIKTEPNQIKRERVIKPTIYRPLKHGPFKKVTRNQITIKQECLPRIKQEAMPVPVSLPQSPPRPIIKQEPIDDCTEVPASSSEVQLQNLRMNDETRILPRIHPKSSRFFKHLATNKT
ncbi:uncharacterized protein AC631_00248 [Debaryomyces fabryi]|uniref:5'-3' DNA helicase ZGRF1-like N-terminal domain-containing protein n=1 Tax=Debaryomyces fabryi TaxID=58627 RepID=A0A0V1Q6J8_9ASCO|nr:uncharacterized protein AC631_00248 [Debaryomyces fabryi]KSA03978.1 hypothetical protein AC631_00248 [Debaryomyces fabryi]CUM53812.1 unnamed protein product [Debaryomyces fabryi]